MLLALLVTTDFVQFCAILVWLLFSICV